MFHTRVDIWREAGKNTRRLTGAAKRQGRTSASFLRASAVILSNFSIHVRARNLVVARAVRFAMLALASTSLPRRHDATTPRRPDASTPRRHDATSDYTLRTPLRRKARSSDRVVRLSSIRCPNVSGRAKMPSFPSWRPQMVARMNCTFWPARVTSAKTDINSHNVPHSEGSCPSGAHHSSDASRGSVPSPTRTAICGIGNDSLPVDLLHHWSSRRAIDGGRAVSQVIDSARISSPTIVSPASGSPSWSQPAVTFGDEPAFRTHTATRRA